MRKPCWQGKKNLGHLQAAKPLANAPTPYFERGVQKEEFDNDELQPTLWSKGIVTVQCGG
jgi:hypothetical protein